MPKYISLRAFDLLRTHHQKDVHAITAQRAMIDAQKRQSRGRRNASVVGKIAERYRRRHRAEVGTLDQVEVVNVAGFQAHLCRALKIEVGALIQSMQGELWMARLGGMNESEMADMIRECVPAAIDEWQQENRHVGRRVADISSDQIDIAIRDALSAVKSRAVA